MAGTKLELKIGLNAAIITVTREEPLILVTQSDREKLPFGPFDPLQHRTMEIGLRDWVFEQTGLNLGYVEQLYTFADRGRHAQATSTEHEISVGYLALHNRYDQSNSDKNIEHGSWQQIYRYFPWEDWRYEKPAIIDDHITPLLDSWINSADSSAQKKLREERAALSFSHGELKWDEEKVLERYELLYEIGLVQEAKLDGKTGLDSVRGQFLGKAMHQDHRRILATALSRLRGKLKYRPVVFELMPPDFTLFELQRCVEAVCGLRLHKQNFRRQVERTRLVEETGQMTSGKEGRPAKIFKYRQSVIKERLAPGLRVSSAQKGI